MKVNRWVNWIWLPLLAVFSAASPGVARAQPTPSSQKAPAAEVTAPADPLGRETPYGTVTGFLKTADQGNYELAASYFQLPRRKPSARDQTTARELKAVLNHNYFGSLDQISRDPDGNISEGLPPDRESIGKARTVGGLTLELELVRVSDPQVGKIWLFSAGTVRQVADFYERMPFVALQKDLPDWLNRTQFFSLTALELVLFLIAIPIAWTLARLLLFVAGWAVGRYLSRFVRPDWRQKGFLTRTPLRLALIAVFHYLLVSPVLPLLYEQYYGRLVRILFVIALYWLVSTLTDETASRIEARLPAAHQASAHSLLSLGRRLWKILVALVLLLIVLKSFGFEVTSALAGIGIGGIALGLGAQKTLENLFGGVSILSDGALRVGDFCKVGDQIGTVEDIGLRSTRIRTLARTVLSIPNGSLAEGNLENFAGRDKIFMNPVLSLRYETAADQMRYVIVRIREVLSQDPRVETGTLRVRFIRFGSSSLDLEVFAYILTQDYSQFLSIQEELFLRIMDVVEEAGTGFAFPSQTTYLGRDTGLDPEKARAAIAAVERWRDEKQTP
jgi:MscS family membrane protein